MGQDPDAIRQDIEQTRAEMSETVEAVGYKADVPSRAKEAVSEKVDNVKAKVSDTDRASTATQTAREKAQEQGQELTDSARQSAQDVASETRQATGS